MYNKIAIKKYELWYEDDYGEHYYDTFNSQKQAKEFIQTIKDECGNVPIYIVEVCTHKKPK